ncbi:hypothetical protein SCHPADRAFT_909449 [Schizopora paradoxa]|uniref:SET domain-containing protein n=1 Tax=Schizopora paradoxa TaxID=27342 RepID=A0A0H2R6L1_9AGAM|nr:hypothetical protein SCHPADRAFT_909449 [Schizopora paradoxa]
MDLSSMADMKGILDSLQSQMSQLSTQGPRTRAREVGSGQAFSMDQIISMMPKKKLAREDFMNDQLADLKEKADREASLPPEHVPLINRKDLLGTLRATWKAINEPSPGQVMSKQVIIFWPQKYSTTKIGDLSSINVADLMVRKTHKGNYLLCRTICPPVFDGCIGFLLGVEDSQGDTAYLKLCNHAMLLEADADETQNIMPVGTILVLREPTYYTNANVTDLPFIMVESPSDVIFADFDNPILRDVSWKSKLIVHPRAMTGEAWKAAGLKDFKASRWFSSAICFTNCIKFGFDVQVSRLNRAEVYLRLGWNNSALHDAQVAFKSGTLTDDLKRKAVVRMLKALYAMNRYREVLETASSLEGDKLSGEWITKANQRIEEQTTGNYDWPKLYTNDKNANFSPDIADFTGPIEVKYDPSGLRGTYVTRDVKAGELLIFHKPSFCLSAAEIAKSGDSSLQWMSVPALKSADDRDTHRLFCKAVQRVWDDRHMYDTLLALYGGETVAEPKKFPPPFVTSPPLEHPTRPCVDIDVEYLQGVSMFNSFGSKSGKELYVVPSLLNHSCAPTARREFIGDAFALRVLQDMKKGEELTVSYIEADVSYDEKRFRMMNSWRFNCECIVCQADDEDGYDARDSRRALYHKMDDIGNKTSNAYDAPTLRRLAAEAKKTCDNMKRTYHEEHSRKAGGRKYELAQPLRLLANALGHLGRTISDASFIRQSIDAKMQSLTVSGMKFIDKSLSGPLPSGSPSLPVDTSQVPQFYDISVLTVIEIAHSFKEIGDKKRAKRWFDVAIWSGKRLQRRWNTSLQTSPSSVVGFAWFIGSLSVICDC